MGGKCLCFDRLQILCAPNNRCADERNTSFRAEIDLHDQILTGDSIESLEVRRTSDHPRIT